MAITPRVSGTLSQSSINVTARVSQTFYLSFEGDEDGFLLFEGDEDGGLELSGDARSVSGTITRRVSF